MTLPPTTYHRWVRFAKALDYCRLGWLPLDTLRDTPHGDWSVHFAWLCGCKMVTPNESTKFDRAGAA